MRFEDQIDIKRAINTYFRGENHSKAHPNINFSRITTHRGRRYIVLGNCSDTIAVYTVEPDGTLQHQIKYPKSIEKAG